MSICQRKTGHWLVKYKDAASGKWMQRQFKTRELAEEFDAAARVAASKDRPLSLLEVVAAYLQRRPLSAVRVKQFKYILRPGDGPAAHLAERYAAGLNRQDLESVRSAIRAGGAETATVNQYVGMLKSALRWAASEDLIERDPWARYRKLPGARIRHRSGSFEDLRLVYPLLPPWLQWAVRTALALCLRPGPAELYSLTWAAFDWTARTVSVPMSKTGDVKSVFPPSWYLAEARPRFEADMAAGFVYVCRGSRNQRLTHRGHRKIWARACRQAGVYMPFYALRHIAASEMLAAGADLAAVAAQLGHRNMTTTAAFYTHALARSQKAAAETIPALTKKW